jgi:hypothetical protein
MSRSRKQQDKELEHRTKCSSAHRLFLLRLCNLDADGPIRLNLPYHKTLIASRLGMKAETFSRALAKLRQETGIRIKGAAVEIDTVDQLSIPAALALHRIHTRIYIKYFPRNHVTNPSQS